MPLPKSKAIKTDSWAAMFAAELKGRETVFPAHSKSKEEIMAMRKEMGICSSPCQTHRFLKKEMEAGRLKMLTGRTLNDDGKLQHAARYIIVS
jgi:hypothetical protein